MLAQRRPDLDGGAVQLQARNAAGGRLDPVDLPFERLAQPLADAQSQLPGAVGDGGELDLLLFIEFLSDLFDPRCQFQQFLGQRIDHDVRRRTRTESFDGGAGWRPAAEPRQPLRG